MWGEEMQVIHVTGDDDYAALSWSQLSQEHQTMIIKQLQDSDLKTQTIVIDGSDITIELRTFAMVDPEFIQFIRSNIQDYDMSKHRDFFEVE
jgi:hypothetical protein